MNTQEIPKTQDLQSISKYLTLMRTLFRHPLMTPMWSQVMSTLST